MSENRFLTFFSFEIEDEGRKERGKDVVVRYPVRVVRIEWENA